MTKEQSVGSNSASEKNGFTSWCFFQIKCPEMCRSVALPQVYADGSRTKIHVKRSISQIWANGDCVSNAGSKAFALFSRWNRTPRKLSFRKKIEPIQIRLRLFEICWNCERLQTEIDSTNTLTVFNRWVIHGVQECLTQKLAHGDCAVMIV